MYIYIYSPHLSPPPSPLKRHRVDQDGGLPGKSPGGRKGNSLLVLVHDGH